MAHILVIDDEDSIRSLLRQVLEKAGHDVREAANGRQGLKQFQEKAAEVVITDVSMPEMSGLDLIMELTAHFLHVKVIAISGIPDAANQLRVARLLGARRTLQKPFELSRLLKAVEYELAH